MSGETEKNVSGWTIDTLAQHVSELRTADERFYIERDRRYLEVDMEREKALKIKEQADRDALALAREIQTYKDEKANELREQINSERGLYVTKNELTGLEAKLEEQLKPLNEFVSSQRGRVGGATSVREMISWVIAIVLGGIAVFGLFK